MEESYILSVRGKQITSGDEDCIELETAAAYVTRNGTRYISYKEYDPEAPDAHYRTTVKVDSNNIVTVMKGGSANHHLILEKGKRHKCEYNTPFGSLTLGVYTNSVMIDLDDNGGQLKVSYTIDIESETASMNELTLIIKEANNNVKSSENDQQS